MFPLVAQVDIGDTLGNAWARVVELTPKIALFLLILIVGWIVARALARLLETVLEKIGFDRWVERGGVKRALGETPYDASDLLSKVVFYSLILIVLQLAFGVFGPNPVSDLIEGIVSYLPNIFVAILILVVASYLASALREIVRGATGGVQYGNVLATGAYVAVLIIGVFAALDQLQIAPAIVTGLFYAILAVVAGSAIVAIGGGGIAPMRSRVERWLGSAEAEMSSSGAAGEARAGYPPDDRMTEERY
ncbi:MAG TPA: hypothetical protein VJQ79_13890 [Acidimicrobiia bacterium]|nr:hypothetical protein [Acidimicrobiia bacterium]